MYVYSKTSHIIPLVGRVISVLSGLSPTFVESKEKNGEHPTDTTQSRFSWSTFMFTVYWRWFGANFTWRFGLQYTIVDQMRGSLAGGPLELLGFVCD